MTVSTETVTLREYIEIALRSLRELFDERDRLYAERNIANQDAVRAAFASAKMAAEKTETALAEYKAAANEWRATLNDFTKQAAPRVDVDRQFAAILEKIGDLRESRSALGGGIEAEQLAKTTQRWMIKIWITIVVGMGGMIFVLISSRG
jgi:hypothetical protein